MRYFVFLSLYVFSALSYGLNVVLVNPNPKDEIFWGLVTQLTQEAAIDLDINLKVYYSESHRIVQSELIEKIVTSKDKPDYLIFMPYGGSIFRSFNALEKAKIPFVTVDRVFDINRVKKIGRPQEVFKYWLGEIYIDNFQMGKHLANSLYDYAKKHNISNKGYRAIAINGDYYAESINRAEGFYRALLAKDDVIINQIVPVGWVRQEAGSRFIKLHNRHGLNEIVWAASDQMALGVLDKVAQLGLVPNKDFVIGGIDLIPEAIQAIKDNRMTASVGGHFLQGVWALVKVYDYHHNIADVFVKGDTKPLIKASIIDRDNMDQYYILAKTKDFSGINFNEFTLSHRKLNGENEYNFDLLHFIEKLNASLS
ncbi:ABC transporter substrate-binding protein [Colwelliaceae bacterium 6441]